MNLPDRPGEMPMPAQGTWVRTGGGAVGRFVGRTRSGSTWMWYPRHGERGHSFEKMCERFKSFEAAHEPEAPEPPKRRRVRISDDYILGDLLQRWEESGDELDYRLGKTFIEGPVKLLDELGERIEEDAWDYGDMADQGIFDDHEGKRMFARKATVVNLVMLGRRLQGKRPYRKGVWKEVEAEGRRRNAW